MAAKDLFHDAVKAALQKEQWQITADPLVVKAIEIKSYNRDPQRQAWGYTDEACLRRLKSAEIIQWIN